MNQDRQSTFASAATQNRQEMLAENFYQLGELVRDAKLERSTMPAHELSQLEAKLLIAALELQNHIDRGAIFPIAARQKAEALTAELSRPTQDTTPIIETALTQVAIKLQHISASHRPVIQAEIKKDQRLNLLIGIGLVSASILIVLAAGVGFTILPMAYTAGVIAGILTLTCAVTATTAFLIQRQAKSTLPKAFVVGMERLERYRGPLAYVQNALKNRQINHSEEVAALAKPSRQSAVLRFFSALGRFARSQPKQLKSHLPQPRPDQIAELVMSYLNLAEIQALREARVAIARQPAAHSEDLAEAFATAAVPHNIDLEAYDPETSMVLHQKQDDLGELEEVMSAEMTSDEANQSDELISNPTRVRRSTDEERAAFLHKIHTYDGDLSLKTMVRTINSEGTIEARFAPVLDFLGNADKQSILEEIQACDQVSAHHQPLYTRLTALENLQNSATRGIQLVDTALASPDGIGSADAYLSTLDGFDKHAGDGEQLREYCLLEMRNAFEKHRESAKEQMISLLTEMVSTDLPSASADPMARMLLAKRFITTLKYFETFQSYSAADQRSEEAQAMRYRGLSSAYALLHNVHPDQLAHMLEASGLQARYTSLLNQLALRLGESEADVQSAVDFTRAYRAYERRADTTLSLERLYSMSNALNAETVQALDRLLAENTPIIDSAQRRILKDYTDHYYLHDSTETIGAGAGSAPALEEHDVEQHVIRDNHLMANTPDEYMGRALTSEDQTNYDTFKAAVDSAAHRIHGNYLKKDENSILRLMKSEPEFLLDPKFQRILSEAQDAVTLAKEIVSMQQGEIAALDEHSIDLEEALTAATSRLGSCYEHMATLYDQLADRIESGDRRVNIDKFALDLAAAAPKLSTKNRILRSDHAQQARKLIRSHRDPEGLRPIAQAKLADTARNKAQRNRALAKHVRSQIAGNTIGRTAGTPIDSSVSFS